MYLRDWLAVFPRRQFLFLESDEMRYWPDETLHRLMKFLEIGMNQCNPSNPTSLALRQRERERLAFDEALVLCGFGAQWSNGPRCTVQYILPNGAMKYRTELKYDLVGVRTHAL